MRTLIVPCAGSKLIDNLPVFLNIHPDGELLAIKAIRGIMPHTYDRVVITLLSSDVEKHNASNKIMVANNNCFPIEFVVLDSKTNGPADTVYETIKKANISGEFVVRDSHAYISLESAPKGNFIAGLDLTKHTETIDDLRSKSFIVLNEQGQTLDVVEKHFCSDVISVGLYGFNSTEDYVLAYEHLNDPGYPIKKLFVSHIISYLIGYKQRVFHSIPVKEFEDWSTSSSWQRLQRRLATCFLDIDKLFTDKNIDSHILEGLKKLSDRGASLICFTSNSCDIGAKELLLAHGIQINSFVYNCTNSRVRFVAENENDIMEMLF